MRIEFGIPDHGWLAVTVESDSVSFKEEVSDVPGDSLLLLAEALERLAQGSNCERIEWFLEPEVWVWRLEATREIASGPTASVDGVTDFYIDGPGGSGLVARAPRAVLLGAMIQALRRLEARPAWKSEGALDHVWSWEFPGAALARLGLR